MADSYNELFGLGSHSPDAALEGWWPMQDDAANTVVADESGNSRDGENQSGDTSSDTTTGPNAYLTSALNLNSLPDRVDFPSMVLDEVESENAFTLLTHLRPSQLSSDGTVFSAMESVNSRQLLFWLDVDGGGVGFAGLVEDGSGGRTSGGSNDDSALLDTWQTVGLAWDGTNLTAYHNGSEIWTVEGARSIRSASYELTVNNATDETRRLAGVFAGAAAFSRELSEPEVAEWDNGPELINSVAPAVSGTETEDETLSVTNGTWGLDSPFSAGSNGSQSFEYQWTRSDDGTGTNEADISGATSSTYTLVSADVGKFIRCRVRGINTGGFDADADTNSDFTGEIQAAGAGEAVGPRKLVGEGGLVGSKPKLVG